MSRQGAGPKAWVVVARHELNDLYNAGAGSWLLLILAIVLSISTVAISRTVSINLLDARDGAAVLIRLATGVGAVLAMLYAADAIAGERDRNTLESFLLAPLAHRSFVFGKAIAAFTLWLGSYLVSIPYLVVVGSVSGNTASIVAMSGIVGGLSAIALIGVGLWLSLRASSNRTSLIGGLAVVSVLSFPGLLPVKATETPLGSLLVHVDPISALIRFLNAVVVDEMTVMSQGAWIVAPVAFCILVVTAVARTSSHIELTPR